MSIEYESKASIALVASLIRQLQIKGMLGEADIATIFGNADDAFSGKKNPALDAIWVRAQEIIAE